MAIEKDFRDSLWCKCYTVCWIDNLYINLNLWKCKHFCNLKEAKLYAKKMWKKYRKTKLKPYIMETIVPCRFFKKELFNELFIVNEEKYSYNYVKKVW